MSKRWIGKGINSSIKDSVSNNVLNIIRALIEDKNTTVYIPNQYQNGSSYVQSSDPAVHFYPTDSGKKIKITGIQSHQERYNFSMMGLVDVLVEKALPDGCIDLVKKKVWRQYNIIRDGVLCMDYVCATLSEESFNDLREIGILYYNGVEVPKNHKYQPDYIYKIVLKDLPLVSTSWAQPDNIGLYQYLMDEIDLNARIKVLKQIKKTCANDGIYPKDDPNESNIYNEQHTPGTTRVTEPTVVDCLTYEIKGLPEVSYTADDMIAEYGNDINLISDALKALNKQLRYNRFIQRCIVYAIEATRKQGSYNWSKLTAVPRSKTKMSQTTEIDIDGKTYTLVRTVYKKTI